MACCCLPLLCCLYLIRAHEFLTHSLSLFHLASPSPPQPCSWPGRTHSLPLHALAMSVVKPELGLQPDSFPAGLLWCSAGATRHLRTRPLRQVVMARGPSPSHAAWRLSAWCDSPFALRPLLPRLPSTTSAGSGMASGSDLSCAYIPGFCLQCLGRLAASAMHL